MILVEMLKTAINDLTIKESSDFYEKEIQVKNDIYFEKMKEYYIHLQEEENILSDLLQEIRQVEIRNKQLAEENLKYKTKIEKIKGMFIGKIIFKMYRLLKTIKVKFRS